MNESLNNSATIREYLLGRISDEKMLAGIEELLFTDDDFCTAAEIIEDELINDYVFANLSVDDCASFEKMLENNPERRLKIQVTQVLKDKVRVKNGEEKITLFESIKAFFRSPVYAGGFALLLIVALIGAIFLFRSPKNDELASLKNIYRKERPVEPRISGFDYAPMNVTRGENKDDADKNKLKVEELKFRQAVADNPNAENHHTLGVFLLTQKDFAEALKELQNAVKSDEKNSKFHNDTGSAYLGLAETDRNNLMLANEEFSKALELNPNSLEALFNKSLALQKLTMSNEAKEAWEKYLQKDSTSKWADEARKNLEKVARTQSRFKSKEQVLDDFLNAYRSENFDFAKKIHDQTKGMHNSISLPMQLARSYLEAKQAGNEQKTEEIISALHFIGNYEKDNNSDFFVAKIAAYYSALNDSKVDKLLQTHNLFLKALDSVKDNNFKETIKLFEKSRDEFRRQNDDFANLSELWAASFLTDVLRNKDAANHLNLLCKTAELNNFKTIQISGNYWLANSGFSRANFSEIKNKINSVIELAEKTRNFFEIEHCSEGLGSIYANLKEVEKTSQYVAKILQNEDLYYQEQTNFWRNQRLLSAFAKRKHYYSTALDFGKESLFVAEKILPELTVVNSSLKEISNALVEKKEFEEALKYATESNRIALKKEDSPENRKAVAETFLAMADIKSEMKNCNGALLDYEKSFEFSGKSKESDVILQYQLHRGKLLCFQQLRKQIEFQTELETVLEISETYRANIREDASRQAFFDNEQIVFDSAIDNSISQNDSKKAFEYLETSKARSLLDFAQSEKTISEVEKEFGKITKPLSLSEIQLRLPENLQVFEYAVLPEKLVVWKITKTQFEMSETAISSDELDKKIINYQAALREKNTGELLKNQAKELYQLVFPISFEKGKTICLIPDKSLHRLAFSSLSSNENKYLIEDSAVFLSPSSSILVLETENAKAKEAVKNEKILSIGNPEFNREENPDLQDLPQAETEAAEIIKNYAVAKVLLNKDASKSAFLNNMSNFDVIHFAGHYIADDESPNNSRLLFADNDLKSSELAEKKLLRSKIVVLSACDTGVEGFNRSEGAIGIARTFLALGTPIVLASSWKVDSEAAKDLMTGFHNKRRSRQIPSVEALRQSQLEMLKTKEFGSPFYWSAFAITGGFANY
jgi:CHAT domain-containing protein